MAIVQPTPSIELKDVSLTTSSTRRRFHRRRITLQHGEPIASLDISPDDTYLAYSTGKTIIVRYVDSGKIVHEFRMNGKISSLKFGAQSKLLLCGDKEKTVTVRNVQDGAVVHEFVHEEGISTLNVSADNKYIGYGAGKFILRSLQSGEIVHTFTDQGGPIHTCAFSFDNKYVAFGGISKKLTVSCVKCNLSTIVTIIMHQFEA